MTVEGWRGRRWLKRLAVLAGVTNTAALGMALSCGDGWFPVAVALASASVSFTIVLVLHDDDVVAERDEERRLRGE